MLAASLRQPVALLREELFGRWLNVRKLWADRHAILFDPEGVVNGSTCLHNSAWTFAVQSMLVPSAVVAAVVASIVALLPLPAPPDVVERSVAENRRVQAVLAGSLVERLTQMDPKRRLQLANLSREQLDLGFKRSMAEFNRLARIKPRTPTIEARMRELLLAADDYSRENFTRGMAASIASIRSDERLLVAFGEYLEIIAPWHLMFVAIGVIVSLIFARMIRRRREYVRSHVAEISYLYMTSAALFLPVFVLNVTSTAMDYADRYSPAGVLPILMVVFVLLGVVALWQLRSIVPALTAALHPREDVDIRVARRIVANRLVLSGAVSGFVVEAVVRRAGSQFRWRRAF